ncbi:UNVERIFIED_CONTAM: hypothetical protein Sradi_5285700 [Sesamum radiatum]|uniref:Zinc finger PMZ-type domain-containing protein n=1 Tax=Sesamum radiatum TaxID=300843 RepID=A0AAW2LN98_SESRA
MARREDSHLQDMQIQVYSNFEELDPEIDFSYLDEGTNKEALEGLNEHISLESELDSSDNEEFNDSDYDMEEDDRLFDKFIDQDVEFTCKEGFKACRKVIGLDGCFLKGPQGGQLLTAVGIDANNNIFSIAYAVLKNENKDSWVWFLTLLEEDISFENQYAWTFMSDKQKNLIPAFESLFHDVDNRFCVRYLHSNMKSDGFTGQSIKNAFWAAARATRIEEFNYRMEQLKELDENAYNWRWDLTGIPCRHAISAIWCRNEEPEIYVHHCYRVSTDLKAYEPTILPLTSQEFWPKCDLPPPLPPTYENMPGRPKKMKRREFDEPPAATNPTKMRKSGKSMKFRICGGTGHNSITCKSREKTSCSSPPSAPTDNVIEMTSASSQPTTRSNNTQSKPKKLPVKRKDMIKKNVGVSLGGFYSSYYEGRHEFYYFVKYESCTWKLIKDQCT